MNKYSLNSLIIALDTLFRKGSTFKREYIRFDQRIILKELKLGTPIALQELLVGISFLVIQTVVNSIDVVASAGVGVAENIGAGLKERAVKALKYGIMASLCAASVIGTFTFLTAVLFCYIGYYNGCGNTLFVMIQGMIGAFCVRVPVVFFMSNLEHTTLFHIGLATPLSTVFQIVLCIAFMLYTTHIRKK